MASQESNLGGSQPLSFRRRWTRQEFLIVLDLYWRIPFGQFHMQNHEVIRVAQAIGRTPSAVAMRLGNFASLDPELKQRGLRNGSAAARGIWSEMHDNWDNFVEESTIARQSHGLIDETEVSHIDEEEKGSRVTERQGVRRQRVGQDFFRAAVMTAYNYRCCISGLAETELLIASHIVPWKDDEKNRMNPRNGLLLSVLHDKAFDRGFITLDDNLVVHVSQNHLPANDRFFSETVAAYDGHPIAPPEKLRPAPEFLAYHREHIFLG